MAFQNWILKLDDQLTHFSHWKWRFCVLFPSLFVLISILYYAFCFSTRSYYEVYAGQGDFLQNYCGFASLAQAIIFFVLVILVIVFAIVFMVVLHKADRLTGHKWAVFFAFLLGLFILVANFSLKANSQTGHVDWCLYDYFDSGNTVYRPGHWRVILDIFRHGDVEDFPKDASGNYWYENQYYQNKLWHYALAYFMRFNGLFIHVGDQVTASALANNYVYTETEDVLMETTRIPVIFFGVATGVMLLRILEKLKLSDAREGIAMALFAFTPIMIMLPSYYNNDSLSFLFSLIALYYILDWHEHFSYFALVMVALGIGLGMATKLNTAVIALPVAGIMVYDLIRLYQKKGTGFAGVFKEHPYRNFWLQIALFAVIVFPLGLFFSVYQWKAFGIPLGYVWDNGTDTSIYINPSYYNAFIRFFIYPAPDMFFSIFAQSFRQGTYGNYYDVWGTQDFNIWTGFFKSALFGEADLADYPNSLTWYIWLGGILLYVVFFALSLYLMLCIVLFIIQTIKGKHRGSFGFRFYFLLALALIEIVSYIYFNWRYPHTCTDNARYILPFFLPLYIALSEGLYRGHVFTHYLLAKRREKRA